MLYRNKKYLDCAMHKVDVLQWCSTAAELLEGKSFVLFHPLNPR